MDTTRVRPFTVLKSADGEWRWFARTTTAFEDRDGEVLSTKALIADVARADADKQYGPLRWWHVGRPDSTNVTAPWGWGLDLGWCDFNMMAGRTLIESGTFKSAAIARWAVANADTFGLSPGFFHAPTEPDREGVFHRLRRFERSIAPKAIVSNPFTAFSLTRTKEISMTATLDPTKIKTLLKSGFPPETIAEMLEAAERSEKTALLQGVRYKAPEEETTETAPDDKLKQLQAALAALTEDDPDAAAKLLDQLLALVGKQAPEKQAPEQQPEATVKAGSVGDISSWVRGQIQKGW